MHAVSKKLSPNPVEYSQAWYPDYYFIKPRDQIAQKYQSESRDVARPEHHCLITGPGHVSVDIPSDIFLCLKCCVGPATFTASLKLAARMFRNFLINGLLVLGSLLFCLVVGEIVCRIFFPDTRLRFMVDQELMLALEPNQEGFIYLTDGSRAPKVRVNELGLRGGSFNEAAGRRVLFLGDSFTFGSGVEEGESFVSLVDNALGDEISAVNGGHPGFGIYQIEILFNRLNPTVRPELVVVVIWENLLLRQRHSKEGHEEFLKRSEKLNRLKSISVLGTHLYRIFERVSLGFGAENIVFTLQEKKEPKFSRQWLYDRAIRLDSERLLRINKTVRSQGGRLVVVFWPREGYIVDAVETEFSAEITSRLEKFGRENGIPTYSVQNSFQSYPPEELNIPNDGHPTPLAHCLVARELMNILEENGYTIKKPIYCSGTAPARMNAL